MDDEGQNKNPNDSGAPQGIFSTPELTVDTEKVNQASAASEEKARSRVASIFANTETGKQAQKLNDAMGMNSQPVDGDIVIDNRGRKKRSKVPIIVAVVVLVLAGVGVGVYFLLQQSKSKIPDDHLVVGTESATILFDETAPIPVLQDGQYGYINPVNGEWLIQPQYLEAGNFYGQHAIVSYSQANVAKTAIINRSGDIAVVQEGGSIDAYYDTENNIWVIGGDIYNAAMRKINDGSATSNYIGNGYILNSYKSENTSDVAQGAGPEGASGAGSSSKTVGKISNIKGEVCYSCNAFCSAQTMRADDGEVLAVVRDWNEPAKIISLPSGQVLYTAAGTNVIRIQGDSGFAERLEDGNSKYLVYKDGQIVAVDSLTERRETLYNADEYYAEECNGRNSILKADGTVIFRCNVRAYTELPDSVYTAIQQRRSQDLLFVDLADGTELVNLRDKADTIKNYGLGDVMTYDNSPFFHVYENGDPKVCNLFSDEIACVSVERNLVDVAGFGNYFTVALPDRTKVYNAKMEMIYEQKD